MKFFQGSWSFSLAFTLLSPILFQYAHGALTASSLFAFIPDGKPGACPSATYDVDTMVQEAATLAQNAINAINTLLAGNAQPTSQNVNLFQNAASLWGINYSRTLGVLGNYNVNADSKAILQQAQTYYKQVLTKLQSNQVDGAKIVCTAKDWRWVTKLGDLNQQPPDTLLSTHLNDDPTKNPGYYWSNFFNFLIPDEGVKTPTGNLGGDLCDQTKTEGETWASQKFIMMCAGAFQQSGRTLAGQIAQQRTMAAGTTLDSLQTVGGVFLHEMMHWINQNILDVKVAEVGGNPAYGYDLCTGIANGAKYGSNVALKNADSYRTFAFLATFNQVQWVDGVVKSFIGQT